MCGIAGIADLRGDRSVSRGELASMARAISHRGPDDEGLYCDGQTGLASRRLSIIDIEHGHQPIFNETRSVVVVYNGELFDHAEIRQNLEAKGHVFQTHCDTEVIVHLWEQYGEGMFEHLQGQFAFALLDLEKKTLILARDRFGICPLHWTRQSGRLYFASEIKSLFATGEVQPAPDLRGIDNIFTMFAMPSRRTPFRDISAVMPGTYLRVSMPSPSEFDIQERRYWDLDFPDRGEEYTPERETAVSEFRQLFSEAVQRRMRADVPVVGYLSGGVDSSTVCAVASSQGQPIQTFSIKVDSPFFDEEDDARVNAEAIGCFQTIHETNTASLLDSYQALIRAAENPVIDTSCAALYQLAARVRESGYKVVLTGEGADEALGGYPWFKINRLINVFDGQRFRPSRLTRWIARKVAAPTLLRSDEKRIHDCMGGPLAQADVYCLFSANRRRFFHPDVLNEVNDYCAFEELSLPRDRMKRWDPLNRSLYVGYKTLLAGMLLSHKSDRVTMANSIEARYPFLDEKLVEYCSKLSPRWKLRGLRRDKLILRETASEILPKQVALRPKKMFRAPSRETVLRPDRPFVAQLLSEESLRRTGYFDSHAVHTAINQSKQGRFSPTRCFTEMGLVAVFATQLWHHTFIDPSLCELPSMVESAPPPVSMSSPVIATSD